MKRGQSGVGDHHELGGIIRRIMSGGKNDHEAEMATGSYTINGALFLPKRLRPSLMAMRACTLLYSAWWPGNIMTAHRADTLNKYIDISMKTNFSIS